MSKYKEIETALEETVKATDRHTYLKAMRLSEEALTALRQLQSDHHRIIEAKDAEIAQLKADAKSAEYDFEAMYQMVKSRNAEIERLQKLYDKALDLSAKRDKDLTQTLERERVLLEALTECKNALGYYFLYIAGLKTGSAPDAWLESALEQAKQTLQTQKGS